MLTGTERPRRPAVSIRPFASASTTAVDYHVAHRTHFDRLNRYRTEYLANDRPSSRTTARQKLTRLTIQQFHELSTDVYDELVRREEGLATFLLVKEEFHPKRNQARHKLATLTRTRFEDLSSDIHFEITRRYPEFIITEEPSSGRGEPADSNDGGTLPNSGFLAQTQTGSPTRERREPYDGDSQSQVKVSPNIFVLVPTQGLEEEITKLLYTRILSSKDHYKRLLKVKDVKAQRTLNLLHNLLNSPCVTEKVRGSILTALLRLSASSGLYPLQLGLHNIKRESSPVTAGQFGEIWKGRYQGHTVCLKIFKLYQRSEIEHLLKRFSREAIVWSQLSHPNLLPFYGIYHLGDPHGRIGLVSPWLENGNLTEYLKAHPKTRRLPFIHNILDGLSYLHQHQVVHGDLKGVNILVNADGSACLADFGLSSVMDADVLRWTSLATITQIGGTVRWMAPEIIEAAEEGLLHPTFASDMYSLASVMFEALTSQIPYYEYPRDITVLSKVTSGIKPVRPNHETAPELTDDIWNVMINCWNSAPNDRPTIDQMVGWFLGRTTNLPRIQPAQVEGRERFSRTSTLSESDMNFLTSLLEDD